jgi:hypothetical protein
MKRVMGKRAGLSIAVHVAVLMASTVCGLMAGTLALYPGAKVDPEYQNLLPSPKFELKQYYTSDSFDKVAAYYKKLGALQGTESFIETKTRRRITFREKPHDKNATTIEWSNESGEDKTKTFILVDSAK